MARMMDHAGYALEHCRHARQRPHLGRKALRRGPRPQRVLELRQVGWPEARFAARAPRSEEHTSELQSRLHLVCRLLLEKKKKTGPCQRASSPTYALGECTSRCKS